MIDDTPEQEHAVRNLVLSVCDLKQHGENPPEKMLSQSVTISTRMYLHGGCDARQIYGQLHLLEIEQMKWSEMPHTGSRPTPRYGHSLCSRGNELVCFGGLCDAAGASAAGGGGADLLASENQQAAGGAGNKPQLGITSTPFAHSGEVDDGAVYTMECQTLIWTKSPAAPSCARYCHSASLAAGGLNGRDGLVVFGGIVGKESEIKNDILVYDFDNAKWLTAGGGDGFEPAGESPSPRFGHRSIYSSADQEVMIFGGQGGQGALCEGTLYGFNLSNNTWSKVSVQGTSPVPRMFHSFDLIGNRAFAFAGKTDSAMTDLYILDVDEKRWKRPLYEGAINVRAHSAAILHDKIIVFGGVRDKKDQRTDEVLEQKISKKLFFLNVLQIKEGVSEGDFKFKLVTVGDSGVGKSCLLTRFVQDFYSDFHVSTIGVDFKTVITMVKGKLVKLQLWDTAGQERFSVVTGNYYRNSDGFIFVYDATNKTSFDHVDQWLEQVQQHHDCGPSTMKILVGNKYDLKDQIQVSEAEARAKAEKIGAIFMMTSAKTAANVDMAFLTAGANLVEMRKAAAAQQKAQGQASMSSNSMGGIAGGASIGLGGGPAGRNNANGSVNRMGTANCGQGGGCK